MTRVFVDFQGEQSVFVVDIRVLKKYFNTQINACVCLKLNYGGCALKNASNYVQLKKFKLAVQNYG